MAKNIGDTVMGSFVVTVANADGSYVVRQPQTGIQDEHWFDTTPAQAPYKIAPGYGMRLQDLQDVKLTSPSDDDALRYDSSSKTWDNEA